MKRTVRVAVGLALAFGLMASLIAGAWAGEMSGTVQGIDLTDRVLVLDDGTRLWLAEGLQIDTLKEGAKVKVSYELRDGKNVVTEIEVE